MSENVKQLTNDLSAEDLSQISDELNLQLAKELSQLYPIHWIVWHNSVKELELILNSSEKVRKVLNSVIRQLSDIDLPIDAFIA